jgi:hypothetical protein
MNVNFFEKIIIERQLFFAKEFTFITNLRFVVIPLTPFPDRLKAGQRFLVPFIGVRIPVREPKKKTHVYRESFSLVPPQRSWGTNDLNIH